MKKLLIALVSVTALSLGCSSFNSDKNVSVVKLHEKSIREIASNANGANSIFGGDAIDPNRPYITTYMQSNSEELILVCEEQHNKMDEFGLPTIRVDAKHWYKTPLGGIVWFRYYYECIQAQNYKEMLQRKEISKIVVTYRVRPGQMLAFDVYK